MDRQVEPVVKSSKKIFRPFSALSNEAGRIVEEMVRLAGIKIGAELIVNDSSLWTDWALDGMLGIGESYMAGKWDSPHVDVVIGKLMTLPSTEKRKIFNSWRNKAIIGAATAINPQRRDKEMEVAVKHYDLGNNFFQSWLDPHMQYSCGYWKTAKTLAEAQRAKMKLVADKLHLRPGMRVLDIGCGWGGLGRYLIKEHDVSVTGVNISAEQMKWCDEKAVREGLSDRFESWEMSYRDLVGQWDRVVVIGMLEHVGPRNYENFFDICHRCLKDDGILLLQTIGSNVSQDALNDRWITTYIFPNGTLPSIAQIARANERKLVIEDLQNLGPDYETTLMSWHERFQKVKKTMKIPLVFQRMWDFYLLYTAAGFRHRKTQLWQIVMTKNERRRYNSTR